MNGYDPPRGLTIAVCLLCTLIVVPVFTMVRTCSAHIERTGQLPGLLR